MTVETHTTGLSSAFGHDHQLAVRDFTGQASFIPDALETTMVDLIVRADSLALLDRDVDEQNRRDLEQTIRRALETSKYPRIVFHGTGATADAVAPDVYDVEVHGDLNLHGVRRDVKIAGQALFEAADLHLKGGCKLRQTDYGIVPFTFAKGTVGVADEIALTFDLVLVPTNGGRR